MKKERLLKVVEVLDDVRPKLFDLSSWFDSEKESVCRTTACAVGWAAQHPWFRSQGLCLAPDVYSNNKMYPHFRGEEELSAVMKFFGLNTEEAEYLFYDYTYKGHSVSKLRVMKRISKFVKTGKIDWSDTPIDFQVEKGIRDE